MTGVLFWLASAGHMAEASCLRIRTWKCQKPLRKVTTGARVQARERNWYCCTSWPGDGPFGVKEGGVPENSPAESFVQLADGQLVDQVEA
jgi:hypothetical protein